MDEQIDSIIQENKARRKLLMSPYDAVSGEGSPIARKMITFSAAGRVMSWGFPLTMYEEHKVLLDAIEKNETIEAMLSSNEQKSDPYSVAIFMKGLMSERFRHDFEFWAISTVKIQDKLSKKMIPFKLNRPQRKALAIIEKMRRDCIPIRFIICKARQWGGSTLVQIYMAWMQIIQRTGWHSAIVTDVEDQARNIRGMYSKLAQNYPKVLGSIVFVPHEGSTKNRIIKDRGCIVGVGSVQKPDSLRSFDFAMTHMSEVSLWKSTAQKSAEDLAQSLRATVPNVPDSLAAVESSPKGVGNFFHREWLLAKEGKSSYVPIYVAWHEIEMYQKPVEDYPAFIKWMLSDSYAMYLWNLGATLEGIKWYFDTKRGENYDDWRMKSEYSSDDIEAFQSTGARVFAQAYVELARKNNTDPESIGDVYGKTNKGKTALDGVGFKPIDRGPMYIWSLPDKTINISNRYLVTVDVGGRTDKADFSVIKVFDRYWMSEGGKPEVVATWRGHIDQDLLAWKSAQIAKFYNNALLVMESNSLDTEESEGNHFLTLLDEIVKYYPNIYARTEPDKVRQGLPIRYGFQTNMNTKPMIIDALNGALREEGYIERDRRACDEMDTYEVKENGTYGAVEGCHDDIVMTTSIGIWICFNYMPMPKEYTPSTGKAKTRIVNEATI